ncbi:MAG TPA: rhomboid family intramembrane serine protease [Chthoniobacterales bacterium]
MLDLNHILLFIAIASPVILVARLARLKSARPAGWMTAALSVLVTTGIFWVLLPKVAGYVGGTLWALLLLGPALAEKKIASLLLDKRYRAARQVAIVRRVLHPWNDFSQLPSLLRTLELARDGQLHQALDQLASQRSQKTPAGHCAIAFTYALTENWPGLVDWGRKDLSVTHDPAVRALYLRALGETGALEDLAWAFAARSQSLIPRLTISSEAAQELAYLLAFSGRTEELVRLFRGALAGLARDHKKFWIATSELAEGKTRRALERFERLRTETRDAILSRGIARRMATAREFPAPRLSPSGQKLLARLVREMPSSRTSPPVLRNNRSGAPAVWAFILLNVAMFGVEMMLGGSTNPRTLNFLGALEPAAVIYHHEYWRLLTALFLHYGLLHISFNLYALYLLGPALECMIGSARFAAGYLLTGLGSSGGVVILHLLHLTRADQLVGASGCVMGVIGISAGLLLRHRQSPLVGRRLREILIIVAFQTAFDLWTPQVSLGAHMSGFLSGVCIGMIFAARPMVPKRPSPQTLSS